MNATEAHRACQDVLEAVGTAVIGERRFFEEVFVGLLASGHVLIEDVPGTGKTLEDLQSATAG